MKVFKDVRSTAEHVKPIEINTDKYGALDTVYVRTNIVAVDEKDFTGWQYDEKQYTGVEFVLKLVEENNQLKEDLTVTNMETLQTISMFNEVNKQDQSEMMMEIMTLISQIQGGA